MAAFDYSVTTTAWTAVVYGTVSTQTLPSGYGHIHWRTNAAPSTGAPSIWENPYPEPAPKPRKETKLEKARRRSKEARLLAAARARKQALASPIIPDAPGRVARTAALDTRWRAVRRR